MSSEHRSFEPDEQIALDERLSYYEDPAFSAAESVPDDGVFRNAAWWLFGAAAAAALTLLIWL